MPLRWTIFRITSENYLWQKRKWWLIIKGKAIKVIEQCLFGDFRCLVNWHLHLTSNERDNTFASINDSLSSDYRSMLDCLRINLKNFDAITGEKFKGGGGGGKLIMFASSAESWSRFKPPDVVCRLMKKETAFDQNKIFSWIFLWSLIKMGSWFEFQINLNQLMIVKKTLEYRYEI